MRFEITILKIRIKYGKICDKNVVLCRLSIWIMLIYNCWITKRAKFSSNLIGMKSFQTDLVYYKNYAFVAWWMVDGGLSWF
jgi:hypothetical protein